MRVVRTIWAYYTTVVALIVAQVVMVPGDDPSPIVYRILEGLPANTFVGDIIKDAKLDTKYHHNDLINMRFSFLAQREPHSELFKIEEGTGVLRTTNVIDRDEICAHILSCSVKLNIMVQPGQFFQIIKVTVHIMDQNDNVPVFPQDHVTQTISETANVGAPITIPSAEDNDSGVYGIQKYELIPNSGKFELKVTNSSFGTLDVSLILKEQLDREVEDHYTMEIIATDGGNPPKSGSMYLDLKVLDANDNSPKFDNYSYEVSIVENARKGSTIIRVQAADPDAGPNGNVVYDFDPNTKEKYGNLFGINTINGEIYVKGPIDYETENTYHLTIMAKDQGENSLPAYAKVVVKVQDVNDHAPVIALNALTDTGHAQISEDAEIGTFVVHISVSDKDNGRNGQVVCRLNSPHFKLETLFPTEFKIITVTEFDREVQSVYHINLICRDKGQPRMTAEQRITITVVDENDNAPHFESEKYKVDMRENNVKGAYLTKVKANDSDIGRNGEVQYEFLDKSNESFLELNSHTGVIRANVEFDYEVQHLYTFVIIARDQGDPPKSATATLTFSVTDANDEVPIFDQGSYSFEVPENLEPGAEVGVVHAVDKDSPPNNKVSYAINDEYGDYTAFFIDALTGHITTRKKFDREQKSTYTLVIDAVNDDHPHMKSTINVSIKVGDINDNGPIIDYPNEHNNTLEVSNEVTEGHVVTRIYAHDPDGTHNGALMYLIVKGNEKGLFHINAVDGTLSIAKDLQEQNIEHFEGHLVVMVTDQGSPQKKATAELYIKISKAVIMAQPHVKKWFGLTINLVIIIGLSGMAVIIILVLVAAMLIVRFCHKRNGRGHKYNCRKQANKKLSNKEGQKKARNDWSNDSKKQKKAVTFRIDVNDSDNDDGDCLWPADTDAQQRSPLGTFSNQNPSMLETSHEEDKSTSPQPSEPLLANSTTPQPNKFELMNDPSHSGSRGASAARLPHLTDSELEVHEMLQLLNPDRDSETGSNTDSGRGPSEEGDNTHTNPLDPTHLEDRHWKAGHPHHVNDGRGPHPHHPHHPHQRPSRAGPHSYGAAGSSGISSFKPPHLSSPTDKQQNSSTDSESGPDSQLRASVVQPHRPSHWLSPRQRPPTLPPRHPNTDTGQVHMGGGPAGDDPEAQICGPNNRSPHKTDCHAAKEHDNDTNSSPWVRNPNVPHQNKPPPTSTGNHMYLSPAQKQKCDTSGRPSKDSHSKDRPEESVDGESDAGTTTSGSYIVEPDELDSGEYGKSFVEVTV